MSSLNFPGKSKMIINAGIRRIVYSMGYPDSLAAEMIAETGIVVDLFESSTQSEAAV